MKRISMTLKALAFGAAAFALAPAAHAAPVVQNGNFSSFNCTASYGCYGSHGINNNGGQAGYNLTIDNWTVQAPNNSYVFLFTGTSAAQNGVSGEYGSVGVKGATACDHPGCSANFVGADPSFQNVAPTLTQQIGGLTVGQTYAVSFFFAAGQQTGHNSALDGITAGWNVLMGGTSIGSATQAAGCPGSYVTGCFSGWVQETYNFVASSTSELLAFDAIGTGSSAQPPFALLDGVSISQVTTVPEPSTLSLAGFVLLALGGLQFYRRRKTA